MDPAAADFYEEDGKDLDFYDFEPLPTLPEDEVSPGPRCPPLPWRRVPRRVPGEGETDPRLLPWNRVLAVGGPPAGLTAPPTPAGLKRFLPAGAGLRMPPGTAVGAPSLKLKLCEEGLLSSVLGRGVWGGAPGGMSPASSVQGEGPSEPRGSGRTVGELGGQGLRPGRGGALTQIPSEPLLPARGTGVSQAVSGH